MTFAPQSVGKAANPFASAFGISCITVFVLLVAFLSALGVSVLPMVLVAGASIFLWLLFHNPIGSLGLFLAFMPVYTLAFLLAKFFGPSYIGALEGGERVLLLFLVFILWRRNGVELTTPDWFLMAGFALAILRLAFDGSLIGLLTDFNFVIAYAAGRVAMLTATQQNRWAQRAVWIVAILSVLGMGEVFVVGEAPRTLLYLSAANGGTEGQRLDAAFHADGYSGLRESATMFGPLQFAPLCMAALIVWWVYCRNPLPAAVIAAGLICSVTRSAWLGTPVAIVTLAVVMGQKKRLLLYAGLVLALFLGSIPILGLDDYIFSTKTGKDPSAQSHQESLFGGLEYVSTHAFGVGPGNVGKYAVKDNKNAIGIENTYLTLAAEYGIPTCLCFGAFLLTVLQVLWREPTPLSYSAIGIVVGFGTVMIFAALHDVFPLACWLWFPVGLAIRSSVDVRARQKIAE